MGRLSLFLIFVVFGMITFACVPRPESGVTPEAVAMMTAVVTPAENVALNPVPDAATKAPVEPTMPAEPAEGVEVLETSVVRYPLIGAEVVSGFGGIKISPFDVQYTAIGSLSDLTSIFADALAPLNCTPYSDVGGENGVAVGYLCLDDAGEVDYDFSISFLISIEELKTVVITLGYPDTVSFESPIPKGAEEVDLYSSGGYFYLGSEATDLTEFFADIEAMNCVLSNSVGSPSGNFSYKYICMDEGGEPGHALTVGISETNDGVEVSVDTEPLSPNYFAANFPDDAHDFSYGSDGSLYFRTLIGLEETAVFYSAGEATFGTSDCALAGETGGPNAAVALKFQCEDYYASDVSYTYEVTIIVSEAETGSEVSLSWSEN